MPVTMTGMSSSIGFAAKRVPRTVFVEHCLAVAFQRDARQAAGDEGQVVEGGPGARPQGAEAADAVAAQLGLDLDVLDDAGRVGAAGLGEDRRCKMITVSGHNVTYARICVACERVEFHDTAVQTQ